MYDQNSDDKVTEEELILMMRRKPLIPSAEDPKSKVTMTKEAAKACAAKLLQGQESVTLEEFKKRLPDVPEIMTYAIHDLEKFYTSVKDSVGT